MTDAFEAVALAALALVAPRPAAPQPPAVTVATDAGPVRGVTVGIGDAAVSRFDRIPYAAPPTGDLRWRPPRPPPAWSSPLDVSRPLPACPQDLALQSGYMRAIGESLGAPPTRYADGVEASEDCLYLSVSTPTRRRSPLPVLVWLHGGSNVHGWGGDPFFDGTTLARRGVIVVTVNYRLGVLGFLTHPALAAESERGTSGNYGLLDQLAALAWVKRNIAAFGGDPTRLTLAGQSAGATDAACLLTSPLAAGLIDRVTLQSGTCIDPWIDARHTDDAPAPGDSAGVVLARALGAVGDGANAIAALRRLSPDSLRRTAERLALAFDPVVDGWLFPEQPGVRFERGEILRVPVLVGSNADEASSLVPPGMPPDTAMLRRVLLRDYGADADSILALYPPGGAFGARRSIVALRTDAWLGEPARATAAFVAATGSPAFLYRLTRGAPSTSWRATYGAFHGAELPLVFGTDPLRWPYVARERSLGRLVRDYWVAFAESGDPNAPARPTWPRFTIDAPRLLELDRLPRPRTANDVRLDWLQSLRRGR